LDKARAAPRRSSAVRSGERGIAAAHGRHLAVVAHGSRLWRRLCGSDWERHFAATSPTGVDTPYKKVLNLRIAPPVIFQCLKVVLTRPLPHINKDFVYPTPRGPFCAPPSTRDAAPTTKGRTPRTSYGSYGNGVSAPVMKLWGSMWTRSQGARACEISVELTFRNSVNLASYPHRRL